MLHRDRVHAQPKQSKRFTARCSCLWRAIYLTWAVRVPAAAVAAAAVLFFKWHRQGSRAVPGGSQADDKTPQINPKN